MSRLPKASYSISDVFDRIDNAGRCFDYYSDIEPKPEDLKKKKFSINNLKDKLSIKKIFVKIMRR
jgi:hypothetical protein